MKRLELYVLYLCVVLSAGELLGPDSRKKREKTDEEDDVNEGNDGSETKYTGQWNSVDADDFKELKDAMNKEIVTLQEYAEALRNTKDVPKDEDSNKGILVI